MKNLKHMDSKKTLRDMNSPVTKANFCGPSRFILCGTFVFAILLGVSSSNADDYVVRGTLNTRSTDAEYTFCVLGSGKIAAFETSKISSSFGSMAGKSSGTGTWKSTQYEDWVLMVAKVKGKQSYYGSTGSNSIAWSFEYRIEATEDGWFLVLPTKTVELNDITHTSDGQKVLKDTRKSSGS